MTATLFALALGVTPASAQEVVVRNDAAVDDTFDTSDYVAWLDYPECAISVLTPDAADLPLTIDVIRFYLGSSQGNQDGQETLVQLGIQQLEAGEQPTGFGDWAWGEEAFFVSVSSTTLTDLSLDQPDAGLYPLEVTGGSIAVWICPPDPTTGEAWPFVSSLDTAGVVIHSGSPNTGNFIFYSGSVMRLSDLGASGAWIIRAVQSAGGGSGGDGGGSGDGADGGSGDGGSGDGGSGGDTGLVVTVDSITPGAAVAGEAVEIAILGSGFEPGATATIGGLAVSAVEVPGHTALSGRSPSGLPAGTHDVTVSNPSGDTDTLIGAFTVSEVEGEPATDDGGCGCSAGGAGALGLAWLVGPLALWRRRS
jgi:hypothetical protein